MIKLSLLVHYIVLVVFFIFSTALPLATGGGFWSDPEDDLVRARVEAANRCKMCEVWRRTLLEHPRASEKLKEKAKKVDCSDEHSLQMCAMLIKRLITSIIAEDRRILKNTLNNT